MATAPTTPEVVLPPQQFLPTQIAPTNADGGYIIGETDRPMDDRIVAITIGIRATFRVNDREFSGPICMHELTVLKRFYEEQNGSIKIEPGWVPGVSRHRGLTHTLLMHEIERMRRDYRIPRQNDMLDIVALYYGTEPSQQVRRLHEVMKRQGEAWAKLMPTLIKRATPDSGYDLIQWNSLKPEVRQSQAYDLMSTQELDRICNMGDPGRDAVDELFLAQVSMIPSADAVLAPPSVDIDTLAREAEAAADAEAANSPVDRLVEALKTAGVAPNGALAVASLVEMLGPGGTIGDGDLATAIGSSKGQIKAARGVLDTFKR